MKRILSLPQSDRAKQTTREKVIRGLLGVFFTLILAAVSFPLARLPGLEKVGPLIVALILAALWRHRMGYPVQWEAGIRFSSAKLLRIAIILYGFRLNIGEVWNQGMGIMLRDSLVVAAGIAFVLFISHRMKADRELSVLLAIGTGICGAAAIAAVSPILNTKEEKTATGVGLIALMGTLMTLLYTVLYPWLPLSTEQYALWSGFSLHELAHVAAASSLAGPDALSVALLTKLGRVFLLIPVCLFLLAWKRRKQDHPIQGSFPIPWFLVGFIGASLLGSFISIPPFLMDKLTGMGTFLLAAAMAGLGFHIRFDTLRKQISRPFLALVGGSFLLSLWALLLVL
ncbi:YeiH family protein [Marininema halotolerans]|uniref:Conserved hypothetical integral membrane protein n=1 Tax=Marininema halotolerans TaxID=1155944 RepID=A0A1I6PVE7_9BACL|nr:putative sulfate exporter family transporter [Marininema halotolerans]SFS44217.1 conserved hypothetical integral membrane protein [Marininema halotolerans]